MYRCDFLRHHHIQGSKIQQRVGSQYEDAPTETSQYTFYTTVHPPGERKGFAKVKALRLLRTNPSNTTFEENITTMKKHLMERGYLCKTLLTHS